MNRVEKIYIFVYLFIMILNVSGRCDIVAFYTEWFMNRYREGYVDVRNPFHNEMVSRITFDRVDAILFCTKNPIPILKYLNEIDKPMLFHVTLTAYKKDIEPNVINKTQIIQAIQQISKVLGKDHIVVRYDPVFISDTYTLDYHCKAFERLCTLLDGYVDTILISFLDEYKNVIKNKDILQYKELTEEDYQTIGLSFSNSARMHGIKVHTCFEQRDLCEYGFIKDDCMSVKRAFELTGKIFKEEWKARKGNLCHCVSMADIGVYNSCPHFCRYCYANYDENKVKGSYQRHDPHSSLLIGHLTNTDIIKERMK